MKICCECGKKLHFFGCYQHPLKGKKYVVCRQCFDLIDKSIEFYNRCLFQGRQNHKNECYFWDKEKNKCKNEEYFKTINKKKKNQENIS